MALIVTEAIVISYVNKLCVEETVRWIDIEIVDFPRRPGLCRLPALFLVISGEFKLSAKINFYKLPCCFMSFRPRIAVIEVGKRHSEHSSQDCVVRHQQNRPAAVRLCDAVAIDCHRHMPLVHSVITAASTVSQRLG